MSSWVFGNDQSWSLNAKNAKKAICWLHGLGASSADFKSLINDVLQFSVIDCNWYLPQADNIAVTINQGYVMPAWYDIYSLTDFSRQDISGMQASALKIAEWIKLQNEQGIAYQDICIIGFSQGGALALFAALTGIAKVGSILGLSTYLPAAEYLSTTKLSTDFELKLMHGKYDAVISPSIAKASCNKLSEFLNKSVEIDWFDMEHTVTLDQAHKIRQWLNKD